MGHNPKHSLERQHKKQVREASDRHRAVGLLEKSPAPKPGRACRGGKSQNRLRSEQVSQGHLGLKSLHANSSASSLEVDPGMCL